MAYLGLGVFRPSMARGRPQRGRAGCRAPGLGGALRCTFAKPAISVCSYARVFGCLWVCMGANPASPSGRPPRDRLASGFCWVGRDGRWLDPRCSSSEAADGARASVRSPLCAFLGHDLISVRWTIWSALCVTCREGRPCRSPRSPRAAILLLLRAAGVRVRCQDSRYSQRSHTRTLAR